MGNYRSMLEGNLSNSPTTIISNLITKNISRIEIEGKARGKISSLDKLTGLFMHVYL